MAYATKADILNRLSEAKLIQLTDFAGTGAVDDAKVTAALDFASSRLDAYAGGRYTLPLVITDQVKDICLDLAIYKLYQGRQTVPEEIRQDYEDAMKFLADVSRGLAVLDQASKPQASELEAKKPDRETTPRVFEDDHLKGF